MTDTVYTLTLDNTMRINLRRILRDEQSRIRDAIVSEVRAAQRGANDANRAASLCEELTNCENLLFATRALQPA